MNEAEKVEIVCSPVWIRRLSVLREKIAHRQGSVQQEAPFVSPQEPLSCWEEAKCRGFP